MKRARKPKPARPPRAAAPAAALDPAFLPVVKAFAADRRVGLGKMFSSKAVLNVDGRIFAMCVKGNLVVKLPRARVEEMTAAGVGRPFDPGHGRLMKEWISVAGGAARWVALAREARAFVGGRR
ncbi:MAG TPA: hypothetical protein VIF57_10835 [Polyangia bacterium]|jgi:hypothetical protein